MATTTDRPELKTWLTLFAVLLIALATSSVLQLHEQYAQRFAAQQALIESVNKRLDALIPPDNDRWTELKTMLMRLEARLSALEDRVNKRFGAVGDTPPVR